jgi:hypothetical protein
MTLAFSWEVHSGAPGHWVRKPRLPPTRKSVHETGKCVSTHVDVCMGT